mmetsp:Transcript_5218/g.8365  ORF Transcript_5218/g.8365 Transcript_5218/m.8365 type:complete len:83 (-) Transcript_5218:2040-2288(-)
MVSSPIGHSHLVYTASTDESHLFQLLDRRSQLRILLVAERASFLSARSVLSLVVSLVVVFDGVEGVLEKKFFLDADSVPFGV